ncbi:MAG TPA: hypothetical protein VEH79_06455 [Gaiellaceae bacterium]|nr:hypothetical protein [Gaiellaceae bacterium]
MSDVTISDPSRDGFVVAGSALSLLKRWRYGILWATALVEFPRHWTVRVGDWRYFVQGSNLLAGRTAPGAPSGGLHLFANYHSMHMGPLTLAAVWPLRAIAGDGLVPALVLMAALGPAVVIALERAALAIGRDAVSAELVQLTALGGGVLLLRSWGLAAGPIAHLDDVLTMAFCALAVWAVATRRPLLSGVAIGLAVAAKPWGIALLPILLAFDRRGRVRGAVSAGLLSAAAWLPFVFGDPGTVKAGAFDVANDAASALRALGVETAGTPGWLRPTQVLLGLLVGVAACAVGRWPGVLLGALAVRLGLDPATFVYYTPALVLGALTWDLLGTRRPLPVWTLTTVAGLQVAPDVVVDPHRQGMLRLATCAALVAAIFVPAVPALAHRGRRLQSA